MKCPTCGTENESNATLCDRCGAALGTAAPKPGSGAVQTTPLQRPSAPSAPAAPASSTTCPKCNTPNRAGALFCDHCGAALRDVAPAPSRVPAAPSFPPPPERVGTPTLPFRLVIGERQVPLPLKNEVVLGRADLASGWKPDVDLTAYGGTPQAGVSRMNTKITWQGAWMLEDMNSTNGTFFRGQRLAPGQRTPIQNGEMFLVAGLEVTFFEH